MTCPWRCCPTTRSRRARAASLDLEGTITEGGELTHSYSVESNNEVKMTKQEIIEIIERAGFEAVEMDTVYNRVERSGRELCGGEDGEIESLVLSCKSSGVGR